jgi:diamine N-acetyltransferase
VNETDVNKDSTIQLREVSKENLQAVLNLRVTEPQERFIATNAKSIAQAHFYVEAWFRAIYADEVPVGFLMLYDELLKEEPEEEDLYFLWRMMIDQRYQGLGIGRKAMDLLIEHVRGRPQAKELLTSFVPGEGSPEGFYLGMGFTPTGKLDDGEVELVLKL